MLGFTWMDMQIVIVSSNGTRMVDTFIRGSNPDILGDPQFTRWTLCCLRESKAELISSTL